MFLFLFTLYFKVKKIHINDYCLVNNKKVKILYQINEKDQPVNLQKNKK